jgi:hypothetical protein
VVREWYDEAAQQSRLTEINQIFITGIAAYLGLRTRIVCDSAYPAEGIKTERLVAIAKAAGADCYLSGPSAKEYLREELFAAEGIAVEWMNYAGYPEYPQLHGHFKPQVSVLDLLFNVGGEASNYFNRLEGDNPLRPG